MFSVNFTQRQGCEERNSRNHYDDVFEGGEKKRLKALDKGCKAIHFNLHASAWEISYNTAKISHCQGEGGAQRHSKLQPTNCTHTYLPHQLTVYVADYILAHWTEPASRTVLFVFVMSMSGLGRQDHKSFLYSVPLENRAGYYTFIRRGPGLQIYGSKNSNVQRTVQEHRCQVVSTK